MAIAKGVRSPDQIFMEVQGLTYDDAKTVAEEAVRICRRLAPKLTGESSKRIVPIWGEGWFGVHWVNCLALGTKVLKADLTWIPVENLEIGDELIGYDEETERLQRGKSRGRRYKPSYVTASQIDQRPCVEVTFDDGTKVVCSKTHPWLAKTISGRPSRRLWVEAQYLTSNHSLGVYFNTWITDQSREGGWMAGMLDGEGSFSDISKRTHCDTTAKCLSISQNPGSVLDHVEKYLMDQGYSYRKEAHLGGVPRKDDSPKSNQQLVLTGGWSEQLRLLGTTRPYRLLEKVTYSGRYMQSLRERRVVSVVDVGLRPVVVLETSESTYIAEGMGSHNSRVWFQNTGVHPFVMRSLAGKVIPMWIDDPTGKEQENNPKAKTRVTESGKTQVLIFRRAAQMGQRKMVNRKVGGSNLTFSVPMSYPGAPGRITLREAGQPNTTKGKVGGQIAKGNVGLRWYFPGLSPRNFLQEGLITAAATFGLAPSNIKVGFDFFSSREEPT